jgi:CHAD domain-containing protein
MTPRFRLQCRMRRVLKELLRVRKCADADAVHDLRVAIRRCRSVATVMEEVDGHRTWRAVKKLPRQLFRALGILRDLHVLEDWVRRLVSQDDPLRAQLLEVLGDRRAAPQKQVRRAIRAFDQQAWERLSRTAPKRNRLVPPNGLTAHCLALERYEDFGRLHARAVRTETPAPWHALRVGLKRFRYTVESLLPERSSIWDQSLGEMQGLLGEIHDLDILRARITQESDGIDAASAGSLRHAIATRRRACIERYRQRITGEDGLLREWSAGLPHGRAIESATAARLRTTWRAMDPHRHRTAVVVRLAVRLYDGLVMARGGGAFPNGKLRRILQAAAHLHGIHVDGRPGPRHKAARDFLRGVPVPLVWTASEWDLLTEVIRYQRGAEPAARHKRFAQLSTEERGFVRALAGVLRLARSLRRCGASVSGGVGVDETAAYVRLRFSSLQDTADNAARLAAAKHLLEGYLRRPIIIHSATEAASIRKPRLVYRSARSGSVPIRRLTSGAAQEICH